MSKSDPGNLVGVEPAQRVVFLWRYVRWLADPPSHEKRVSVEIRIIDTDLDRP
jgi:hypothetical protein